MKSLFVEPIGLIGSKLALIVMPFASLLLLTKNNYLSFEGSDVETQNTPRSVFSFEMLLLQKFYCYYHHYNCCRC